TAVRAGSVSCSGILTDTWTYTDACGRIVTGSRNITISAPVVTMPAAGSSTVSCVALATTPTPPAVSDNCGRTITPTGPVASADPVCSGTKTCTYTYTDCAGVARTWVYTYTITAPTFTVPVAGGSTVACPADANVVPTAPALTNSCGGTVTATLTSQTTTPACSGTKTYTFTYTDSSGATKTWDYVYTISAPVVTMPAAGSSTVSCVALATTPTPPAVSDNCGRTITPTGPVASADPVCSGTKTCTYTYTDCAGVARTWVYTYTITAPTFTVPVAGGSTVACPADANVVPTAPALTNSCGGTVTATLTSQTTTPACSGTKTYTFTYTDCSGATKTWDYVYTISAPVVTMPAGGSSTVS